jgi:chromosomal replication initiator protein
LLPALHAEGVRAGDLQEVNTCDTEIVSALRAALVEQLGSERYQLWFGQSRLTLAEGRLTVGVSSPFVQDWLRSHCRRELESCCTAVLGKCLPIDFAVEGALLAEPIVAAQGRPATLNVRPAPQAPAVQQASAESELRQTVDAFVRRRFRKFDSFVVGRSNCVAHTSARAVAERLGSVNPLFVYGPPGVGKTHLLESIWSAVKAGQRHRHVVYLSSEQFMSCFLEALHSSGMPTFRRKYRSVELLILDDLQHVSDKKATVVELLHTIDTLLREGRQLVLAADRPPAELPGLGPELSSRLGGGLICRMEPPDYETRLGMVRQLARELNIEAPPCVLEYIAAHLTSHGRELCGALNRLQATSAAHGEPISLTLAEQALSDLIRHSRRAVRLSDIERAVCDAFGLEPQSLQGGSKARGVNEPRMLAMWLARKYTRAALSEISRYFGRRSHSSVLSAQKKVTVLMSQGRPLHLAGRSLSVEDAIRRVEELLRAG